MTMTPVSPGFERVSDAPPKTVATGARTRRRLRRLRWAAVGVPVLLTVLYGALTWRELHAEAEALVSDRTRLIRNYALRLVELQDTLLASAQSGVALLPPDGWQSLAAHRFLKDLENPIAPIVGIALLAPNGDFLLSSLGYPAEGNVGPRDYIARALATDGAVVDQVRTVPDNIEALVVARHVPEAPAGGIWVSAISMVPIAEFLSTISREVDDAASLVAEDGKILARHIRMTGPVVLPPDNAVMQARAQADRGLVVVRAASDGVRRLYAFERVGQYPLFANYGISLDELRAVWARQTAVVAAFMATIGAVGLLLVRGTERTLAAEDERARATFSTRLLEEAQKSAAIRELMLRELNHRVKNSLQMVNSLVRLQAKRPEGPDLAAISARVHAIAEIHDLLHESPDSLTVDLAALLRAICASDAIAPPGTKVVLRCDAPATVWIGADRATPLALCVIELISNATKHAFGPEGGAIRVTLTPGAGSCRLTIADTGRGLPDVPGRESGLRIVSMFVSRIGATMDIERGGGTRFVIDIPARAQPEMSDTV